MKKHIKNHTQRPYITLVIENCVFHTLRTLKRVILGLFFDFLCEFSAITKTTDFNAIIFDEQTRWFQICMYEFLLGQIAISIDDISEKGNGFCFFKASTISKFIFEISLITEFSNYVTVIDSTEYIVALDDIRMFQFLKCFRLYVQYVLRKIMLSITQINHSDDDFILILLVDSSEDVPFDIKIQVVVKPIGVIFYFFSHIVSHTSKQ